MSVYITGDCHSDFSRLSSHIFPEQKEMTRDDVVIIAGDFGGVWYDDTDPAYAMELKEEKKNLDWLERRPFTTVFVDGNHENFNRLYSFPVKEWNGGKVHVIRPHVLHLMRGQVYTIQGQKYFSFGGASSHDISDGIIDPDEVDNWRDTALEYRRQGKRYFRVKNISWWPQESFKTMDEASIEKEKNEAYHNLKEADWNVRFIISHEMPASTLALFSHGGYKPDAHSMFLEEIKSGTTYSRWFCGHYHHNKMISDKDIVLYEQIIRIW